MIHLKEFHINWWKEHIYEFPYSLSSLSKFINKKSKKEKSKPNSEWSKEEAVLVIEKMFKEDYSVYCSNTLKVCEHLFFI